VRYKLVLPDQGVLSHGVNKARNAVALTVKHREAEVELKHRLMPGRGIDIQPDIQYVTRPTATGEINDALPVGAKAWSSFNRV
jgi:carbohydrate-selective porin OprB